MLMDMLLLHYDEQKVRFNDTQSIRSRFANNVSEDVSVARTR